MTKQFWFFMIHVTVRGTAVKVDKCIMYICNFVCKLDTLKCKVNRAIIIIMVKMKSVHFNPNNKKRESFNSLLFLIKYMQLSIVIAVCQISLVDR